MRTSHAASILSFCALPFTLAVPSRVSFWATRDDCEGDSDIKHPTHTYVPDCTHHLYVYEDFYSVLLSDGGNDRVHCRFFSDRYGTTLIPGHGDDISNNLGKCYSFGGKSAKSMICDAGC